MKTLKKIIMMKLKTVAAGPEMEIECASKSHPGRRDENQDYSGVWMGTRNIMRKKMMMNGHLVVIKTADLLLQTDWAVTREGERRQSLL